MMGIKRGGNPSNDGFGDGDQVGGRNGYFSSSTSVSLPKINTVCSNGVRSIEHQVSKFDTLAGIAIKYGVEVEDIKHMNCLVTDFQMFAHKKVQIPLPGRHPPSQNLSKGSSHNRVKDPTYRSHIDLLESFQSLKLKPTRPKVLSSAMTNLQGYYGLPADKSAEGESTATTVYRTNTKFNNLHDERLGQEQPHGNHQKTRSGNGYISENEEITEDDIVADGEDNSEVDRCYTENSVRRRQKADVESSCNTSGLLSRTENGGYSSGKTRKNPALKKFGIKADLDLGRVNSTPIGDLFMGNGFFSVKKSSSTSNLQDSDTSSSWPTSKWTFNTNAMARPLFDGLPKPIAPRTRRKAAPD